MGIIKKISGPVITATDIKEAKIHDVVKVGNLGLLGEIIEIRGTDIIVQVYEETDGLKPGEKVESTGKPLSVELGPGMLGNMYDGVQRPLSSIKEESGSFIARGIYVAPLDETKKWDFKATVKKGDEVKPGMIIGTVQETSLITHKILVPQGVRGTITDIKNGKYNIRQAIGSVKTSNGGKTNLYMTQTWPVKQPRPIKEKATQSEPLITGQRIYDFFFPTIKGGQCAIPGPFGCGKTVTQQAIAKWCDAQVIVYVGCGERGNEMTDIVVEFPELQDPKSGKPLMDRTIVIANTSNMPVAAREASVYTGMTIAEYFRDQGIDVALMADSTSRWAEAMREISGRLEEMPGEEGYPAYLGSRIAQFYERAGTADTLSGEKGSITIIGAVSPAGGDFSEPVTQNTLKIVKVFWALDASLAAKRHYWAINWLQSYSLYNPETDAWYNKNVGEDWGSYREQLMQLLQEEAKLNEIAQLVGKDSLPQQQQFVLLVARLIREDFLQQNAFDEQDMYCPPEKQYLLAKAIIDFYEKGKKVVDEKGTATLETSKDVETIGTLKYKTMEEVQKIVLGKKVGGKKK